MEILCWNVRGVGNPRTVRALRHEFRSLKPQIIFLSETKCNDSKLAGIKKASNLACGFSVPSKGSSGGLMLLWEEEINVAINSFSEGQIDATVKMDMGW